MTYESFQIGNVIIKQDDPSNNKLYIIITGSVSVIINFGKPANSDIPDPTQSIYGKIVNTIYNKGGFGEKALLEKNPKNAKRTATIMAC